MKIFIYITMLSLLLNISRTSVVIASEQNEVSASGLALSSFPSPYIPNGRTDYNTGNGDIYESNDNTDIAVCLNPPNYFNLNLYRTKINGTLNNSFNIMDYDYFYFNLLTESYLTITINSNNSNLYDFAILTNLFSEYDNNPVSYTTEQFYYNEDRDYDRCYKNKVPAGTYYIALLGHQSSDLILEYELNLYIEIAELCSDIPSNYIVDQEDIFGLSWISDFIPLQLNKIPNLTNDICYYNHYEIEYRKQDKALEDFVYLNADDIIPLATYYIWDPLVKYYLYKVLSSYSNILTRHYLIYEKIITDLSIIKDTITNTIEIVGFIKSLQNGIATIVEIVSEEVFDLSIGFEDALITALNIFFELITPKIAVDSVYYYGYINNLAAAFEVDGVSDNMTMEEIQSCADKKIVCLKFTYSFSSNHLGTEKYISFKSTLTSHGNDNIFSGQYFSPFYTFNDKEYKGNLFILSDLFEIGTLNNLTTFDNWHVHSYNSYNWRNTSTHNAICGCGKIVSQGHAILKGNNICILCGGRADSGFIGLMNRVIYKTKNGSYKLNNGIIVLVEEDLDDFYNGTLVFYKYNSELVSDDIK